MIDKIKFPTIVACVLCLFFACKPSDKANLIIEEGKLIEIITDVQIAKSAIYKYPVSLRDSISQIYYDQIYEIHGIDKFQLEHDLKQLENKPTHYKKLMDSVFQILKIMMEEDLKEMEK